MSGEAPSQSLRHLAAAFGGAALADCGDEAVTSLDPTDWTAFRAHAHAMLDAAFDRLETHAERPVWTPLDGDAIAMLREPLPKEPAGEATVFADMARRILPYPTGNTHPRFFGWVHGAGTPMGVVAEAVASAMNANAGGRNHAAIHVERQVIEWCRTLFAFPDGTSGLLTSGTSMATLVALAVARHRATGGVVKQCGLTRHPHPLVGYASVEAHASVTKAFELLGLGSDALRLVAVDAAFRIDVMALDRAIAADRQAGLRPFCVVGNAGTVNTGAIDDIAALADLCTAQGLWLHIDGAFGALVALSGRLRHHVAAIERADSLAFDFHKWMHVPYDAGCVLVRDGSAHRATFAGHAPYLAVAGDGLAGGEPWFCDFGPELSRGFRALKVWATFRAFGARRLGEAIAANCALARYLARRVSAHPMLELMAPVSLAIVCLRYVASGVADGALNAINAEIVADMQNRGVAAPSLTALGGATVIRVAIFNHRTRRADVDALVDEVVATGTRLRDAGGQARH